jgi:hypothetical protein
MFTEPAKVSCEGTQLEVARGEKFCKASSQIKNADPVTKESAGAGKRAGWGFSTKGLFLDFLQRRLSDQSRTRARNT